MPKSTWAFASVLIAVLGLLHMAGRYEPVSTRSHYRVNGGPLASPWGGTDVRSQSPPDSVSTSASRTDFGDSTAELIFPQIGDGALSPQLAFRTSFILAATAATARGTVEFFDDKGAPLELTVNGTTGSVIPFTILSRQTARLTTAGTGPVKAGWARIRSDQAITGAAAFEFRDSKGVLQTSVGVAASELGSSFTLFADMIGSTRTGLALVNPNPEQSVEVTIELRRKSGSQVVTDALELPPGGHQSFYLDEFFSNVDEFEGSALITGTGPISGLTLRATGVQLTSMPMVAPPGPDADWQKFCFPQIANGAAAGLRIDTTIVLFNNTGSTATGDIDLFDQQGAGLSLPVGGTGRVTIPFSLAPGAVERIATDGSGDLKIGWALVSADRPITGTSLFTIVDSRGQLISEVGVGAAELTTEFDLIADSLGSVNTGIALANAAYAGGPYGNASVMVELFQGGYSKATAYITLDALHQTSLFITDLFKDYPGIDEFDGLVKIKSQNYLAPLCLRQEGILLTSMPSLQPEHAFRPGSTMEPAQNLAATSPAIKWTMAINSKDLMPQEMVVFAPGFSIAESNLEGGALIGYGIYPGGDSTRTFGMYADSLSPTDFTLVQTNADGLSTLGAGAFAEVPGGIEIRLAFSTAAPYTITAESVSISLSMQPGILVLPAAAGQYSLDYQFASVPFRPGTEQRIIRRITQRLNVEIPDTVRPNITSVEPLFPRPGHAAILKGTNFGETVQVLFPTAAGSEVSETATRNGDGDLVVTLPPEAVSGAIRADSGGGPGNPYRVTSLFGPEFAWSLSSGKGGASTPFRFDFTARPNELAVDSFEAVLNGVTLDTGSLQVGQQAGSGSDYRLPSFQLTVASVSGGLLRLDMTVVGSSAPAGTVELEGLPGNPGSVRIRYSRTGRPAIPNASSLPLPLTLNFTGVKLKLPTSGNVVSAEAEVRSCPTGPSGVASGIVVERSAIAITE